MKKNKTEILDPEVDDLCAILAQTIIRPPKQMEQTKTKQAGKSPPASGRHPPDEAAFPIS